MSRSLFVFAFVLALPASAGAQTLTVQPYLQLATPNSVQVMWETDGGTDAAVEWGLTDALGQSTAGVSFASGGQSHQHHHVLLDGLLPATRYHYRVVTGTAVSEIFAFVTPAEASSEESVRIVAMSDMQQDWLNPDKFSEVVSDGVIDFVSAELGPDLPEELSAVLIPGDLVDNGLDYSQWIDTFFAPAAPLFRHVPVYPVPGNHENDSAFFFDYFALPDNGTDEHWWWHDVSNVRVIGLDSNSSYRTAAQLAWLDVTLAAACVESDVDFVFAQLHHPHKSELWLPGEIGWTGDVIERLEAFSTDCGKPSLHFFGHTHGYSRGQSRDHRHLWVNVATAGGNIDYWGEYAQADYDEFVVSQDEWGFVLVEVEAGADPQFRLRRVSRGNETLGRDNDVRDDLTVRTANEPPSTPTAVSPVEEEAPWEGALLIASIFGDPEGDAHGASHWQVSPACDDWSAPLVDRWVQDRNEYGGTDLNAGIDLSQDVLGALEPGADLCWRVRYRDAGLAWSDWSAPAAFTTTGTPLTDNLLINPGAEDGTTGWTATEGVLESLTDGECAGIAPYAGDRYFGVGALCEEHEFARAVQRVGLEKWSKAIDDGRATARFGGWFADYAGSDLPQVDLLALDAEGETLATAGPIGQAISQWTELQDTLALPEGTRSLDFVLLGTRFAGSDNDSYLDDLELRLAIEPVEEPGDDDDDDSGDDDDDVADDDDVSDDDDSAPGAGDLTGDDCGCSAGAGLGSLWLTLLLLPAIRRRRPRAVT